MASNSWLRAQRKSELVEIAEDVGLTNYESLKKMELEIALDKYLTQNSSTLSDHPKLYGYYNGTTRTRGSPIKKELANDDERPLRVAKRRVTRAPMESSSSESEESPEATSTSTALARTPARNLSLAARIPLPATPADVAQAVDRHTVAVRQRVASIYHDSGITEATHTARESLSTVTSVIITVACAELFFLRREVIPDVYVGTIPAFPALGLKDYPVHVPDMFLLLSSSFWCPVSLWFATSILLPSVVGYFYNLTVPSEAPGRRRGTPGYTVDPLTFSIVKALATYLVYALGVDFGGLVDEASAARVNGALFGGWKGMLVGSAITGLVSLYDAVLRK